MELPDFSSLYEAESALGRLEESLEKSTSNTQNLFQNPHLGGRGGPVRAQPRRQKPQYVSDGICGLAFGTMKPAFANPLGICCQMLFFTQQEYDRHISEHVPCPGLPGVENSSCCKNIHPSTVKIHLEIEHRKKTKTDEAVEQDKALKSWREARAKKYPTFERVQAKIREVGYRMNRGQIFVTRKFGSLNKRAPLELQPIPDKVVKRFKSAPENDDSNQMGDEKSVSRRDNASTIQVDANLNEPEHIDEDEKIFSDNGEEEKDKSDEENERGQEVAESDKYEEYGQESPKNPDDNETPILDDEEDLVDKLEVPLKEQPGPSIAALNYDSDRSWSGELEGDEDAGEKESKPQSSTYDKISKLVPIVDYESSSEESIKDDAGDAKITPRFSPPKNLNLIDQLEFFKPQTPCDHEANEEKEDIKNTEEDGTPQNRSRRRRGRYSQIRQGRRNRLGTSSRRLNRDVADEEDDLLKHPSAVELELGLELDEISSKGGQKAFANHPVVEMARKRHLCMRRASTILKRPTLLHMLLAEEIRHERNQLMQCVRFVVNNNFFL
nr:nuclear fragile X mental retardation interacting [Hymenolepis microstoma]